MSRWSYLARRLVFAVPVVIFSMTITFIILRMGPLDPVSAILGPQGNPRLAEQIRQQLHLNRPLWDQYLDFMLDLFTLDLGESWVIRPDTRATTLIADFAPRTVWLGFWSVLIAIFVGIPLGFYAGLNPNTFGDYVASFGGIVWRAMPNFWLAIMLLAILSSSQQYTFGLVKWESVGGIHVGVIGPPPMDFIQTTGHASIGGLQVPVRFNIRWKMLAKAIKKIAPPAIVLGSASMGNEMRIGRTAVLETINSNYVETARAKGVSSTRLVWKHVFRNAMIPLVPIITNEAFLLLGGSVIVETVFGINGLGYLFFRAILAGDLPLVGSLMFIFVIFLVSINILQDFLYTVIDPRVGYEA